MKTVTLSVNDALADRLSKFSPKEINSIMDLAQAAFEDRRTLKEMIRDAQRQAKKNGLTKKKLDAILKELE